MGGLSVYKPSTGASFYVYSGKYDYNKNIIKDMYLTPLSMSQDPTGPCPLHYP